MLDYCREDEAKFTPEIMNCLRKFPCWERGVGEGGVIYIAVVSFDGSG